MTRRRRLLFASASIALALGVPICALFAVDVYLHGKYQTSAGYNVWGYRGPVVGRKQPGEIRIAVLGGSSAYGYGVKWDEAIPAQLERTLARRDPRRITVVNLGYNNEGAYSLKFTLEDYQYLRSDVAVLYESYNDLMTPIEAPNLSVFRRDSPVFRLTGYLPIFPIVFKEKAAAMLHGGDPHALYRASDKTVFSASVAQRAAAGVLTATAEVGQSLERQLGRMMAAPARQVAVDGTDGCRVQYGSYCRSMFDAVSYARARGAAVLVAGQPYEPGDRARPQHIEQQRDLSSMIARRFAGDRRVRYVNLGRAVELADPQLSFDRMHLTAEGNRRIADALVAPLLELISAQQVPIQTVDIVDEPIETIPLEHERAAGLSHRAPADRIVEQRADAIAQRGDCGNWRERAHFGSGDHVPHAADIGADAGDARRERFDQRDRRAFVPRRQQEHIGGAVDRREIAPPAEKADPIGESQLAHAVFEVRSQLSVAGDQKDRARTAIGNRARDVEEDAVLLDRRQAADRRDYLAVHRHTERAASGRAARVVDGCEGAQVEAERDHAISIDGADVMLVHEFIPDLGRDRDNRIAHPRELTFGAGEESRREAAKISIEHVTVVRVHDPRAPAACSRAVVGEGREPADRARLRHVGVDDVGVEAAEETIERRDGGDIVNRRDLTAKRGDAANVHAAIRQQVAHVAFVGAKRSVHEQRFDAAIGQALRQRDRLDRGSSDVQPRDDARDTHAWDDITRTPAESCA
jgi:hypothetical protein